MKAIVVTDQAAGTAGMTLAERPEPESAGNDVLMEVHASGFTPGSLGGVDLVFDVSGGDIGKRSAGWSEREGCW